MKNIFQLIAMTLVLASCAGPAKVEWVENPATKQKVCTLAVNRMFTDVGMFFSPGFVANLRFEKELNANIKVNLSTSSAGFYSIYLSPTGLVKFTGKKNGEIYSMVFPYEHLDCRQSTAFTCVSGITIPSPVWDCNADYLMDLDQLKKIAFSETCTAELQFGKTSITTKFEQRHFDAIKLFLDGCYSTQLSTPKDATALK